MSVALPLRISLCVLWLLVAAAGIAVVLNYEGTAGARGETPAEWPSDAPLTLDSNRDTLVMFAHPQCPCTRASMEELNRLLANSHSLPDTHIYFLKPEKAATEWTQTSLWKTASAMPGVSLHEDYGGAMAQRFGAKTSGFVVLYSARGHLLFKGGITSARGHIGDNESERTLVALLGSANSDLKETPVYGCSLSGEMPARN